MNRVQFGEGACEKTRRYMDAYISNELLVETNHEMLRHLETCPACSAELETRGRLRSLLKSAVQNQPVPPGLPASVREQIRRRQTSPWTHWALASAAAFALCIAAWLAYPWQQTLPDFADRAAQASYIQRVSATVASIFKSGLGDHIHCAVFRKYPRNPPTVEEMEDKLGPEYRGLLALVEPVVPPGYRVVMAHQCTYGDRHFVHLTMRKGEDLISVVITKRNPGETLNTLSPAATASGVPLYQSTAERYQIAAFESERYLAFVVSTLEVRKNLQLAAALAPAVRRLLS
jgi:anti-sigma factor (TIGR02949 family)